MAVEINENLSLRLRAVGFFCTLLVVPIHCFSYAEWFAGTSSLKTWDVAVAFLFTDTISRCAVPCFFVLSVFFLALRFEPTVAWYRKTLCKRFVSLYVPFVIWNIFYLCRSSLFAHHCLFSLNGVLGYNLFKPPGFGLFWYIQVVLLAVVFSPIWLSLLRNPHVAWISVTVLAVSWWTDNFGHYYSLQLSSGNFLWLFIGAITAFNLQNLKTPPLSIRTGMVVVLVLAIIIHIVAGCCRLRGLFTYSDKVIIVFGVLSIFVYSQSILNSLSRFVPLFFLSFFIYAMHPQGLLVHIPLEWLGVQFIPTYLARIACGILIPIACGCLMKRFSPRVLSLLVGGRVSDVA